ncbi:MAG TPA: endolytic transglycosylase MltG [Bacillales bacterium]|nr:endolytic transglycosylase MltG [Bacillales bacterium]
MANNSLRSFASGMIIATSILTAVYYFQPLNKQEQKIVENDTLTDEKVQAYMNNSGYIYIPEQTYDELVAKNKEYEAIKNQAQKSPQPKEPVAKPQSQEIEKKTFTLTVKSGMGSIPIANLLENAGIVDSGKKFEQFLTKKDWTRSIQVGTYELNSSMSYEEIGRIITKR